MAALNKRVNWFNKKESGKASTLEVPVCRALLGRKNHFFFSVSLIALQPSYKSFLYRVSQWPQSESLEWFLRLL